jgi:hypothetical protein
MPSTQFDKSAAPHNRQEQPQAYFILRALYKGPNHQTLKQLAAYEGLAPGTAEKRPRYFRSISPWCTRKKVGRAYVYSRIPGKRSTQVLREFRESRA